MAAPKGNTFWKQVEAPTGRPKKYTPETLWAKAQQYFKWVQENPLEELKVFGTGLQVNVPKMRAMTERAFCLFAGIDTETLLNYKSNQEPYKDFFGISMTICNIIYQQKFEGAAADFLNANIIARELGLKDNQDVTTGGEKINRLNVAVLPLNTVKELEVLLSKANDG